MIDLSRLNKEGEFNIKKFVCFLFFLILLSFNVYAADYVIGDGDSLQISVWGSPELGQEVIVRPDGKISLPAQGDIQASGLTPEELKKVIEKKLTILVKKPIVTVIVTTMTNYQVLVFGKGSDPGIHTLKKKTTLLQFLSSLGPLDNADLENAYLMRNQKKIKTGFYELFRRGDLSQDVLLERDDIVYIPDNFAKRINVFGAVHTPSTIPYRDGLTILDILLAVEGFTEFANKSDVEILRKNDSGGRTKISVRARDLEKGNLGQNVAIMPGDIIVVKETLF